MAHPNAPSTPKPIAEDLSTTLRPPVAPYGKEAQDRRFRAFVGIVTAAVVFIAAVGAWSYSRISASLRDVRASNMVALLELESRVLQIWIDEKKRDAERWASSPEVQADARSLVKLAAGGMAPPQVCASAPHRTLMAELEAFAALEESVAVNLIGRDGRIVASQHAANCGQRIANEEFMRRIAPVFEGRTVFVRPWLESERIEGAAASPLTRPLVWVETPILDETGEVVAALGFGRYAEDRFGKLLAVGGTDSSRESYTFGRRALLLSASRYEPQLHASGVLAEGESAMLRLAVRDPGVDLLTGPRPSAERTEERPLTALAGEALEGLRTGGLEGFQGVVLEPYRNYRGAEVVGAWRWLPEKELAIAVEVEAAEAYAPLHYLQVAFAVLFGFLLAFLLTAAASSVWAARLRLRERNRLGQYTIEREIGEGGLSHVYLARHPHLKRPTAVKVLKAHLASDEVVTRFVREVQLCSQLTHPNTIEIYDYGRTRDGLFFYAMEYLRGISLEDLVRRDGALPLARAVHVLRQACGSLREAHARGLVHRDVKPHNLMLCVRGEQYDVLKVLDFGLVKETHNPHTRDITQFARVLGTPLYMAPERLRDPADADARSDIYAIGAVAHFLLTGRPLFEARTDHDLIYQVLNVEAPTLASCGLADAPPPLQALLTRCLAKNREARPAAIGDVDAVLGEIAGRFAWREEEARAWWQAHAARLGVTSER